MPFAFPLSIVSATLNERGNVRPFVQRIENVLDGTLYELVIVDDGSQDGTLQELNNLKENMPNLSVIVNRRREGLLLSNFKGLSIARGRIRIVMDSDLQHPPEYIPQLVRKIEEGWDCVVMSRFTPAAHRGENRSLFRNLITYLATHLSHLTLPDTRMLSDPVSGFFALGPNICIPFDEVNERFSRIRGYKTLLPIIVKNSGRKITELPYRFEGRKWGESKIASEKLLIPRYINELARYREIKREGA
jgi:dolichol-phosphate mannosyltransferase